MRIDILTLHPKLLKSPFEHSILHRAIDKKIVEMSSKISEINNNSYVIIEENFSNDLLSSKRNDDEKKVQEVNRKTNFQEDQVESINIKNMVKK